MTSYLNSYGSWQIDGELDNGGMGLALKARREIQIGTGNLVQHAVVKIIKEELTLVDKVETFLNEMLLLNRVNCPYIAPLLDAGEEHGEIWFSQEFISGQDLNKLIGTGNPLSEYLWETLALHSLLALKTAHAKNVSHLDIKPSNIMFSDLSETFKLIDFGLAKVQSSQGTSEGPHAGTSLYMAPEHFQGNPHKQSDIWSLGVTLFEAATGVHPLRTIVPDWDVLPGKEKMKALLRFMADPQPDWNLIAEANHRTFIQKMMKTNHNSRSTPAVLLHELRRFQGFRQPVVTLGGNKTHSDSQPLYWTNFLDREIQENNHWELIRSGISSLLKQKGSKIGTIAVDLESPEATDLDIRYELFDSGSLLIISCREPNGSGVKKALSLGWRAGHYPSEICYQLPGNCTFEIMASVIADLLEIGFGLKATEIRIF